MDDTPDEQLQPRTRHDNEPASPWWDALDAILFVPDLLFYAVAGIFRALFWIVAAVLSLTS